MEEPPLNAGHAYAAQAEEYAAKGQIDRAAEAHKKAAENYLRAQETTENPEALQALLLLQEQHEQKHRHYSSLPKPSQNQHPRPIQQRPKQPTAATSRQRGIPKAFHSVHSSTASIASTLAHARAPPIREEGSLLILPRPQNRDIYRDHNSNSHNQTQRTYSPPSSQGSASPTSSTLSSPPGTSNSDPFDKFYQSLQEMLSRLSHPLAFATAPLDGTPLDYGSESFYLVGDDLPREQTNMGDTIVPITRSMAATMLEQRAPQGKTLEEYAVENRQLKIAVDQLSRKLASYKETVISSSSLLKNSMHHLRAATATNRPTNDASTQRIKELEEEVRRLNMENARVRADLEKMQRRWDRLKEGARRRRREGTAEEEREDKEKEGEN